MNTITWSIRARTDLLDIEEFIARDDPDAATRWALRLHRAVEVTRRYAHAGRVVRELGRPEVREIICGRYRIVYAVRRATICVLTIFEGHKLLPRDFDPDVDQ